MIKMPIIDFIEEVKAELFGYEEITEEKVLEWENKFNYLLERDKIKSLKIKKESIRQVVFLKDESEVFQIADGFFMAIVDDDEESYWDSLKY